VKVAPTTPASLTRFGPFEVVGPLGSGGMGEVLRARDPRLGREVAIKVLPVELSADVDRLRRFEREARNASALNHPNIVTIYDAGTDGGVPWIAMELVDGQTLRQLIASGPLPVRKLLSIATQIAKGLARAHEVGIVHRDLKPENVMVTKDGLVKILDFGLAKLTAPLSDSDQGSQFPTVTGTSPGVVMGTVAYMSPEQAAVHAVDFRSDQFALGSILYEMATGKGAFQGRTAVDILAAILNEDPEPIASVSPQTPAPLRWVIERCLSKEPRDRYTSTDDLARDLATFEGRIQEMSSGVVAPSPRRGFRPSRIAAGVLALAVLPAAGYFVAVARSHPAAAPRMQKVTFHRGVVHSGRFTPDGRKVVYAMRSIGDDLEPPEIFETEVGRLEARSLGLPPGDIRSISAGGQMAIILNPPGEPLNFGRGTLADVSLTGGTPRELLEGVEGADWSPDGKELAVVRLVQERLRLEFPIGKTLYEGVGICCPRVAPDGAAVAFEQAESGHPASIRLVDRNGRVRTLGDGVGGTLGIGWSPRGEIWWIKNRYGSIAENSMVHAVDLKGRERLVGTLHGDYYFHDLSRDGRLLVERNKESFEVVATVPGKSERSLDWLDTSVPVALSADGQTLLFSDRGDPSGSRGSALYLRSTDGAGAVRLGDGEALALSPDAKWALAARGFGKFRLVLLPTKAGQERILPGGAAEFDGWAAFHPNGGSIFFSAHEPGHRVRVYRQDLDGGMPEAVSDEGVNPTLISPDGTRVLARSDGDDDELLVVTVDGGRAPAGTPIRLPRKFVPILWSADGMSALVWETDTRPDRVDRLDLATGRRTVWRSFSAPGPMGAGGLSRLLVSNDESAWVAGYHRLFSELLVVDGLR
jgi:eukaryotic-like serine/threonine-protein kinase